MIGELLLQMTLNNVQVFWTVNCKIPPAPPLDFEFNAPFDASPDSRQLSSIWMHLCSWLRHLEKTACCSKC